MLVLRVAVLLLLGAATAPSQQTPIESADKVPVLEAVRNRFDHRLLRFVPPPPLVPPTGRAQVQELYMDQILDHYNPNDKRTWKQRYFARSDLYQPGGPVFIFIGGEGQESAGSLMDYTLFITYLAENFGAKTYDLEHRFYGKSHPLPDLTTASLQYLSADQALADLAYFIEYLTETGGIVQGQQIVVFGGSYPGNLAAWARYKYPHLIRAAISSSAPVHAKADFIEYMEVVGRSMTTKAGQWCFDNVKKATDRIVQLLQTAAGYQQVRDTFRVGSDLVAKLDLDAFFETLSGPFAHAVQYNRDSTPQSTSNIKYICSFMSGNLTPDQAMAKLANLVLGKNNIPGIYYDWSYRSSITGLQNTAYTQDGEGIYGSSRQWIYQTCSEFGYYQTYSAGDTPFPKGFYDVSYNYQLCKDVYGTSFDKDEINAAVKRTNLFFGDRAPDVTNVFFLNGNIDPWYPLGILGNLSRNAPAVLIDGGSHCADMDYPNAMNDSPYISAAHTKVFDFLRNVLLEEPNSDPGAI
ncbi:putative serine protease K12H4.7 [Thrips palmi]|uniref:Serine protease K12H4.7 n=1 Tax=Thrips palmi TaxID=161013 RepID=A0A6P9ADV5_THRPL|nr:putative serine protease K12H4.7 [Thrips palmi]XP_034255545.1 putative serine protease K12H4.7 [Thrips palmi]